MLRHWSIGILKRISIIALELALFLALHPNGGYIIGRRLVRTGINAYFGKISPVSDLW